MDGVWQLREMGATIAFGATFSQGLPAFGARTAQDASFLLPLSRQGADAVFTKAEGRFEVTQSLPENLVAAISIYAQTAFDQPLLTSEQFNIVGPKMLSGFPAGTLPGDSAWSARGELQRPIAIQLGSAAANLAPYVFGAAGERILHQPTVLEIGTVHATNLGGGFRLFLPPPAEYLASGFGFLEASKRWTMEPRLEAWRIFAGAMIAY